MPGQVTTSHWRKRFVHLREPSGNAVDLAESIGKMMAVSKSAKPHTGIHIFPVAEDTGIESMALAQNREFWQRMDRAHKEGEKKGFTKLEDLPDWRTGPVPPGEILKPV